MPASRALCGDHGPLVVLPTPLNQIQRVFAKETHVPKCSALRNSRGPIMLLSAQPNRMKSVYASERCLRVDVLSVIAKYNCASITTIRP